MELYGFPLSSHARRVQMLCEEIGIPYNYRTVDLDKNEQSASTFLALNPNGKVPAIDDDGFTLWESHAIMRYLADKHRAKSWYPTEPRARASVEAWLDWNHTRLGQEAGKMAFHTLILKDKGDPARVADARKWLEKILPVMDAVLQKQPYLCGAGPTLPDLSAATNMAYLEMCRYDLSPYPAVIRWYEAMKARPSFSKTALSH
jgi:glutathione S-transferase